MDYSTSSNAQWCKQTSAFHATIRDRVMRIVRVAFSELACHGVIVAVTAYQ
jgi:hypothetical protein